MPLLSSRGFAAAAPTFDTRDCVPMTHPCVAGHFPGHPVVPAVVMLERVVGALCAWQGPMRMTRLEHARFVAVLRPGEAFRIALAQAGASAVQFACQREDGTPLAHGKFLAEPIAHAT